MTYQTLEAAVQAAGNPVELLRNSQIGPYAFPVVRHEFTNWRDEQRSWRETCALFDQSHHMSDLYIEGPDAVKLLSDLGVNSFKNFKVNQGKQFVACTPDGYVIGDAILFYLDENKLSLVGRPPAGNWVHYNVEAGKYNVKVERDERSAVNQGRRKFYRYQIQGPNAEAVIRKLNGGASPDIKFFRMGYITIAGRKVRALRHGMAGAPGLEVWGPYNEGEEIRAAILEAGKDAGIVQVGARAYATNTLESGWIPSPVPAIYTGDKLKAYREWLPVTGYEANAGLGGSFVSDKIEDYYTTPWELGYNTFTKYDHDFIGQEALQAMEGKVHRKKVTFAWNHDDVGKVLLSMFAPPGENYKFIDLPLSNYASSSFDKVMSGGKVAGASMFSGFSWNERTMLSLGFVEEQYAKVGTELTLVWGEENGGTKKTTVERHKQTEIRVVVGPTPYAQQARETYQPTSWRTKA